ncbi:MAG TPA: 3-oxoacyl-ACP reductase, partial [Rhodobiaceae bacterium]|nr:3-oxoacyl-ACP reductase [Rhodobiaceae bacterium]
GAGVFAAAQVVESPGKLLGLDAAAEDVAANWEEISDLTEAKPLGMGFEQSAKFFALHNLKR